MFLCDSHTHSKYSFDGKESIEDMVKNAISKNIKVLTITDHCDAIGIGEKNNDFGVILEDVIPQSVAEIREIKNKYSDKIKILAGMELGEPTQCPEKTKIALNLCNYDFILASTHQVRNREDFYFLEYNKENVDTLLTEYFSEQLEIVRWNKFDSLAHFDYPLRYINERTDITVDFDKYNKIIEEIFNILIRNNKSLEINTSTIKKSGSPMPHLDLIKKYRDLGGKMFTLGSDAHTVDVIGKDIDTAIYILKDLGYKSYYYYENHNPIEVKI